MLSPCYSCLAAITLANTQSSWKITNSSTEDLETEGRERWAKGDHSFEVQSMLINRAFLGNGWGGFFPEKDNELLGIKAISMQEFRQIIKTALERSKSA